MTQADDRPDRFIRPRLLGIVNMTEDSFSDGGRYLDPEAALRHGARLADEGADILDLGPASSHPDSKPVSWEEEIRRLGAVLPTFRDRGIEISIDSFLPETQIYGIEQGAEYLNDIQGFPDAELYPRLADAQTALIVMHSVQGRGRATRVETDPDTVWPRLEAFFERRLEALINAGVDRARLILDPGMGFFLGLNPDASLMAMSLLARLKHHFKLPVLVSVSRKSFLQKVTGRTATEVGAATLAAELWAARASVDYIRTHDIRSLHDALAVWTSIGSLEKEIIPLRN